VKVDGSRLQFRRCTNLGNEVLVPVAGLMLRRDRFAVGADGHGLHPVTGAQDYGQPALLAFWHGSRRKRRERPEKQHQSPEAEVLKGAGQRPTAHFRYFQGLVFVRVRGMFHIAGVMTPAAFDVEGHVQCPGLFKGQCGRNFLTFLERVAI